MDAQTMVRTAIVLFAITALGGLLMAGMRFSGRPRPPSSIARRHGLRAASALTLGLDVAFTTGLPPAAWAGLVLLLVAALGGLVLNLRYHSQGLELPIWLVLVHAAAAVAGFLVLAVATWNLGAR